MKKVILAVFFTFLLSIVYSYAQDVENRETFALNNQLSEDSLNSLLIDEIYEVMKYKSDYDKISTLLEQGADINVQKEKEPVLTAVLNFVPSLKLIQFLIEKGANINVQDSDGNTPLMLSLEQDKEYLIIFKYILQKGADLYIKNNDSIDVYTMARVLDYTNEACLLEKYGAKRNLITEWWFTVYNIHHPNQFDKLQQLIDEGVDIDLRSTSSIAQHSTHELPDCGTTALMYLAKFQEPLAIKRLLDMGANPKLKDGKGRTALDYMDGIWGDKEASRKLLEGAMVRQ